MHNKINIVFLAVCTVLVMFCSLLAYDNIRQSKDINQLEASLTSTQQEVQLIDQWVDLTYNKLFGVYRMAKAAYLNPAVCWGDRQFKFDCMFEDYELKSWRKDLLSNE